MRYSGKIGFSDSYESDTGIWDPNHTIERSYYGDVVKNVRRISENDKINDDVNIGNQFSIVGDSFAHAAIGRMKYITFAGQKWKITNVEIQYPRLTISVGGIYNG